MAKNRNIGGIYAELSLKDIKFRKGLQNATKQLKGFAVSAAKVGTMAIGAKIAAAGVGIVAAIEKAMSKAAEKEVLETQFSALLKSEKEAIALIDDLRKMNVESPLGVDDFSKAAKQLLGVRMTADETVIALDKLSNISMGNAENFDSLVRAFAQTRSAGRLMGQEVLQFVNAGFNPLSEISIKTGESMADLKRRMEEGRISFQEVEDAITSATAAGGLFNGMNAKMAETMEGKMQKLQDNMNQFFIAMGKPINETLIPALDNITNRDFSGFGERFGNAISDALWMLQDGTIWEVFRLGGERALLALRQSDAMGGLIALMATGFDFARGEGDLNPMDTLNRNINAVLDMNEDDLKRIDNQIETLLDQARKNREAAIEASEKPVTYGPAIPLGFFEKAVFGPALPDGFFDQPKTKASMFDEAISSSLDATMQSVNSMQARGLAQGAIYTKSADDKKIGLIESINRILIQASKDSTLRI